MSILHFDSTTIAGVMHGAQLFMWQYKMEQQHATFLRTSSPLCLVSNQYLANCHNYLGIGPTKHTMSSEKSISGRFVLPLVALNLNYLSRAHVDLMWHRCPIAHPAHDAWRDTCMMHQQFRSLERIGTQLRSAESRCCFGQCVRAFFWS